MGLKSEDSGTEKTSTALILVTVRSLTTNCALVADCLKSTFVDVYNIIYLFTFYSCRHTIYLSLRIPVFNILLLLQLQVLYVYQVVIEQNITLKNI